VSVELTFQLLSRDSLDQTVSVCALCAGENLYPRSRLASILEKPEHQFWLLTAPAGEIAGYAYFYLTDLPTMARMSKLPEQRLAEAAGKEDPAVWNLQAYGIAEPWRGHGLSRRLLRFTLEKLREQPRADIAVGVCWKPLGRVPMGKAVNECGFRSLGETHRVWYDVEDLVCPYCQGRCVCDAEVYYIKLSS